MVSDAALGFVTGFMGSSYVEGLRLKQTALARAQVQRELREEENNAMINDMFAISKTMQNATEEEKDTLRNRLNKFSPAGLQKISTLQMTGGEMFIKQEGSYGIKPLTTSKPTESEQKRNAFLLANNALNSVPKGSSQLEVWKSLPTKVQALAISHYAKGGNDHSERILLAQQSRYINTKVPTLGATQDMIPQYEINQDWLEKRGGKEWFRNRNLTAKSPEALTTLLYSDLINERRAFIYAQALRGSAGARKFIEEGEQAGQEVVDGLNSLVEQSISPTVDSGIGDTSTDILSPRAFNELTNKYNQDYFENMISGKGRKHTRAQVIKGITENLVSAFSNAQYIKGNKDAAQEFIREYIAEQYDLAMEQKVQ